MRTFTLYIILSVLLISLGLWIYSLIPTEAGKYYDKWGYCQENLENFNCPGLLDCDLNCNKLDFHTQKISCHAEYTNQILVKCKGWRESFDKI